MANMLTSHAIAIVVSFSLTLISHCGPVPENIVSMKELSGDNHYQVYLSCLSLLKKNVKTV